MARTKKELVIEPIKETKLKVEIIGDSTLILSGKARSYERAEVFKQSHDKGTEMPKEFMQPKNPWEQLITSIHWLNTIEYHDEDYSLYTEEEWNKYMSENKPCILSNAWFGTLAEAFKTFGYKDSTGKAGTDFQRAVNIKTLTPIEFSEVRTNMKLVPNTGINKTNVVQLQNEFDGWKCELELSVADVVFPYATILSVIQTAGTYIGLQTQRKNGYGRYHIGNVDILS